ncbi:MAG: hypothetical protein GU359_08055 [Desulfurococcales archaeon]|nr:hypothetical protein [Desulfurococcales archaeon]
MNRYMYKPLYILFSILLLISVFTGFVTMPKVLAQVASIVSVSTPVYPGEPVTVTFNALQGNILINVTLASDSVPTYVWASQAVLVTSPGTYTVTLTLPKSLPGLSSPPTLYVIIYLGTTLQDFKTVPIYPKIEVTPPKTTNVDELGRFRSLSVCGYGYDSGTTVSEIIFNSTTYPGTVYTATLTPPVTVGSDGSFCVTLDIGLNISSVGMAGGVYNVNATVSGASYPDKTKLGVLEILPQAVIYDTIAGTYGRVYANGRCDSLVCDQDRIQVYLYGFPPSSSVPQIQFVNRNYTGVNYNFTFDPATNKTDANGYAVLSLARSGLRTNMSAGDYYIVVYIAPAPQTFTNTTSIPLGAKGTVTLSLPNGAKISAVSYVAGKFDYVVKASDMSYTITDTLRIDFTYGGYSYRLAANWDTTAGTVTFAVYNTSTLPYTTLFTATQATAYNATIGANVAVLYFNITPLAYTTGTTDAPPTPAGSYVFWASFYGYTNQILLVLRQYQFVLSYANLSITLTAPDGTKFSWYFEYPGNYTYDGMSVVSAKVSQTYAGYKYDISFSYDASTQLATLRATLTSLTWTSYPFLNQYYLVRPVLVILWPAPAPGPYMPGQALVIAAYGYGPGYPWTTVIPNAPFLYNNITIRLDYTVLNASLPLDKDGNATFAYVYLPAKITFGVHYLKGTDSWGYEYTEAIIIGVAAYWAKIVWGKYSPDNRVSAGYYNNARIEVCPCPESLGVVGMKYCGKCAVYAGDCDYLGDYIEVVVSGLVPGESVNVSFGGVYRGTVTADSNGMARIVFVVPTLPSGQYVISIVGSITGYRTVDYFYNGTAFLSGVYPVVYPKIVLLDLTTELAPLTDNSTTVVPAPVIVGSGIVQVVGTGFTPGVQFLGVLINNTDATASVNSNVARWNANSDGVLVAYSIAGRTITPGLWIPMVEPGKYKVELVYLMPGFTVPNVSMGGYVFVINNISIMATKDDLSKATSQILSSLSALDTKLSAALTELSGKLDTVISQLSSLNNTLTGLTGSVATLSSKLDALSSDLKSTRSDVLSAISGVDAKVTALQSAVASARSDILSAVAGVDAKVTALSGKIDTLTTSLANVTTGLSTLMSQLKDLSDKMSTTLATLSTTVAGLSTKIDTVTTALSDLKTAVAEVSSKVDSVSATVSDLKNSVSAVSGKIDTVSSAVSGVSSKVDDVSKAVGTVSSKLDTMSSDLKKSISDMQTALSGQLSTASVVLYVATILALLAFVFALLAYLSVRKATATK